MPTTDSGRAGALHRSTGAAPVCAVLLALALVVALLSPGARRVLHESFQRRPERYVDLYFTDPVQAKACPTIDGRTTVRAAVRSHLAGRQDLGYALAVTSAAGAAQRVAGTVATDPGRVATFGATLTVPAGDYGVTVTLPGRSERLSVHCTAAG